jgi:DegV family protein with EDD domain
MSSTAIIVDAACDLPESLLKHEHLYILPFNILSGTSVVLDDGDFNCKLSLYDTHLRGKRPEYASTKVLSEHNITTFLNSHVLFKYDSAVFITVSSSRSEMFKTMQALWHKTALACTEERRKKGLNPYFQFEIIDSKTIGPGIGLLAYAALAAVKQQKSAAEITHFVDKTARTVYAYGIASDLLYVYTRAKLKNENSINWGSYTLGNLLNIKPILGFRLGESANVGRARGFDKAWKKVVWHLRTRMATGLRIHVVNISYSGDIAQFENNIDLLRLKASAAKRGVTVLLSQMSLTLALHIGQDAVMVAYSSDEHSGFIDDDNTTLSPAFSANFAAEATSPASISHTLNQSTMPLNLRS